MLTRSVLLGALLFGLAAILPAQPQNSSAAPAAASAAASAAPAATDGEDIRDIRGPKAVRGAWPIWALIIGALVLAAGAYAVWHWSGRGKRGRALGLAERTLAQLEAIRPLMQPDRAREFGIAASEIVRTYVERRFEVVATQRTTEEFLQSLMDSHAPQTKLTGYRPLLGDFLQQCDLVKFAGSSLAAPDMETLFQSARKFVLETGEPATA